MPMSMAAMDGIRDNGHRWKLTITGLKPFTEVLGKANDLNNIGKPYDQKTVEKAVQGIVAKVREFAETKDVLADPRIEGELLSAAADLECVEDEDIEEINDAMGQLYDAFDYWRILVQ